MHKHSLRVQYVNSTVRARGGHSVVCLGFVFDRSKLDYDFE